MGAFSTCIFYFLGLDCILILPEYAYGKRTPDRQFPGWTGISSGQETLLKKNNLVRPICDLNGFIFVKLSVRSGLSVYAGCHGRRIGHLKGVTKKVSHDQLGRVRSEHLHI